jgi:hypothetical protein
VVAIEADDHADGVDGNVDRRRVPAPDKVLVELVGRRIRHPGGKSEPVAAECPQQEHA